MTAFYKKATRKNLSAFMVSTTLAAGLMTFSASAQADNWGDHQAEIGTITIDTTIPNTTNIFQQTDFAKVRGDGDIDKLTTVNLSQPGSSSIYALYDTESDPTVIEGRLNANGQVVIFDKQGTIFTKGSVVKVGSILTSTGHITDDDLQNQKYNVVDADTGGAIVIDGSISVADGGLAAFVAPSVVNNGVITAKMGKVIMASGDKVTLDLYGDNLVEIALNDKTADGMIENTGVIDAAGGTVYMGVQTAKKAVDTVINTSGIVKVSSVEVKGGKIILSGGAKGVVKVSGELAANGTSGGAIKVTGQNIAITETAVLTADAGENGDGGTAYIYGTDYAIFRGRLSAIGGTTSGNGGHAEVSAGESVGYDGLVNLSASQGDSGTLLIDPRHLNIGNAPFSFNTAFLTSGGVGGTVNINDQALANTLRFSNVNLWATETLNTTSNIDISTWKGLFGAKGITANALTLAAPTVNLLHEIILGQGELNVRDLPEGTSALGFGLINVPAGGIIVETVNLNAPIYTRSLVGGTTVKAGDAQLNSDADIVNVKSDKAFIQQGIWLADIYGISSVNVADGNYKENLTIKNALHLKGSDNAIVNGSGLGGTAVSITGDDVTVENMTFLNFAQGIISTEGRNLFVLDNNISRIKGDGIRVSKNDGIVTVSGNRVTDAGDEGIEVHGSEKFGSKAMIVNGNVVIGSGDDGIQIEYATTSAEIKRNIVKDSGSDGLEVHHSDNVTIARNKLTGNHDQGIDLEDGSNIRVYKNKIRNVLENEGIYASNIDGLDIIKNKITNTEDDGIYVEDSFDISIRDNKIRNIEGDGIHVENVDSVDILRNRIKNVDDDGIEVFDAGQARILGNRITSTGDDGIVAYDIGNIILSGKASVLAEGEGESEDPYYALIIKNNTITDAGKFFAEKPNGEGEGSELKKSKKKVLEGDGIDVSNVSSTLIDHNKVTNAYDDGIVVTGSEGGDEKRKSGYASTVLIHDNDVNDSGADGIEIRNMMLSTLDINRVLRSGSNGFLASGSHNGDVILTGNTFRNNPVGARFESGLIDLTGDANTFRNGKVAMQFDPAMTWGIIGYKEEPVPTREDRLSREFVEARPIYGEIPASLSLVDNTIGATIFDGPSKYYVELLKGALFNPDQPTVINALNATFDDTKPFLQAGVLSDDQFNNIENKIQHYTDVKSLGLFIFGLTAVPDSASSLNIAQQDIFLTVPGFDFGGGGINLTITGLPQIPGFSVPIANFLAGIAPAAGGTTTPQALASIEPSAGGNAPATGQNQATEQASCWGDALSQASQGGIVTMTYDESPANALSAAASCQSGI